MIKNVKIWVGEDLLSKHGVMSLYTIPNKGDEIIYKTIRCNPNMKNDKYNYTLLVDRVVYETEETWNNCYRPTIVHVYTTILHKELTHEFNTN